ncbi:helix-turn-helix domain-containing protein [Bordetella avium]|uniref:Transcriptional regulator n=1 Tax=Bordetella avium (strain 197N) TaxID=360910 RepID=Q2KW20_BORA1|nr:XRE family transcriptional regulator [Bordetella avium]AZY48404.1 XRE family transcriptional regulator [Bordetella avium]AZY51783.1 XRE family transcriptional regulator [Bordetella avium]RIQ13353.1 XRE family transcriptional regulator [Bordetella avium]RIQ31079.1 XRE family transcriptional regulator [Bordetella avium]RIQ35826.1 XRE family transcriptional regulator [Bordetella avium]
MSEPVLEHVSANVRRLRAERGLSQTALAARAGLSRRMIVGLESGEANISLAKLGLIATALDVNFIELVSSPGQTPGALTWRGLHPGSQAHLVASAPGKANTELWIWTLAPGERYQAEPDPPGWSEILYVIEGELTLRYEGVTRLLAAGSATAYDSCADYAYLNEGETVLRFTRNVVY